MRLRVLQLYLFRARVFTRVILATSLLLSVVQEAKAAAKTVDCNPGRVSLPNFTHQLKTQALPKCLSESEASAYLIKNRVVVESFPDEPYECGKSAMARMASFLQYFEELELNESIVGGAGDNSITRALQDPWKFFSEAYKEIHYYESKRAFASFSPPNGIMRISQATIDLDPVAAVTVLIHEAAHANPGDPGHEICYRGELKYTNGACDGIMSHEYESAGAYVVQFWFAWLYSQHESSLTKDERSYLNQLAHETLSQRLNHSFDYAYFGDQFFGVSRSTGQPLVLDPLTGDWIQLAIETSGNAIKSSYFSELELGPIFVHENGKVSGWNSVLWEQTSLDSVPLNQEPFEVRRLGKLFNIQDRITRNALLTEDGSLFVETTNLDLGGQREFVSVPTTEAMNVESFGSISGPVNFVKLSSGILKFFGFRGEQDLAMEGAFPKFFFDAFESLNGFEIFAIDGESRRLLLGEKVSQLSGYMMTLSGIRWHVDPLQNQFGLSQKYQEGISFRALLSDQGQLSFTRRSKRPDTKGRLNDQDRKLIHLPLADIKDFAIGRSMDLMGSLKKTDALTHGKFRSQCDVAEALQEPWLHRWIGVGINGDLVLQNTNGACRVLDSGVETIRLVPRDIRINTQGYPEASLEITYSSGEVKAFYPYESFDYWRQKPTVE